MRPFSTSCLAHHLVMLAMLVGLVACNNDDDSSDPSMVDDNNDNLPTFGNALAVGDQLPSDRSIILVDEVTLDDPGYLVIREALADHPALPGAIIGLRPLSASSTDVEVSLERPVRINETLFATLHVESNDNDSFDFEDSPGVDPPALDAQRLPTSASFTISLGKPSLTTVDQSIEAPVWMVWARIDEVLTTSRHNFVALHESIDDLSSPLGVVALEGFEHQDVLVPFGTPIPHNTTLFATLHEDLGEIGVFEPALDTPIIANQDGALLSSSFTMTLEPVPNASLECAFVSRASIQACVEPSRRLPLDLDFRANHDGSLVVRYTDVNGDPRAARFPVSAGDTSLPDTARLPVAHACPTTFDLSLLVEVEGVDPLSTEQPIPYATDATGSPAVCSVDVPAEQAVPLIADLRIAPANRVEFTSTINGFDTLARASAFIALIDPERSEIMGFAQQTSRTQSLSIELSQPIIQGQNLTLVAYADEGERGVFNPEGRIPEGDDPEIASLEDPTQPLAFDFTAMDLGTSEPFITTLEQSATQSISVRQTVHAQDALIVVFAQTNGRPDEFLGFTAVTAGVNQDVTVDLSRQLVEGESLYVGLHSDDGNQSWDDAATDPVLVRDARPVTSIITIAP